MKIDWYPKAAADFAFFQESEPKIALKIERLLADIFRDLYRGLGKPEPLKHNYSGCWSRRINDEHRLVYRVDGKVLIILQCRFHYDKK